MSFSILYRLSLNAPFLFHHQSDYIHYVEGFLITPGYIDLGELRFWATELDLDDARLPEHDGKDEEKKQKSESGGGRQLNSSFETIMDGSIVDIVVFKLVSVNCNAMQCNQCRRNFGSEFVLNVTVACFLIPTCVNYCSPPLVQAPRRDAIGQSWELEDGPRRQEPFDIAAVQMLSLLVCVNKRNWVI